MCAHFPDTSFVKHDDLVGMLDCGQPVSHHDGCASSDQPGQRVLYQELSLGVDIGRGLVKHEYRGIEGQSARERQQLALAAYGDRVRWVDALPDSFDGVVVGNEVLDAMPVQLLVRLKGVWHERGVAVDGDQFAWADQPTDLAAVTTGQIELYRNQLMKAGAAKATVNRKLSVVRRLFERAMAEGWVSRNPATLVRGLRADPESN